MGIAEVPQMVFDLQVIGLVVLKGTSIGDNGA